MEPSSTHTAGYMTGAREVPPSGLTSSDLEEAMYRALRDAADAEEDRLAWLRASARELRLLLEARAAQAPGSVADLAIISTAFDAALARLVRELSPQLAEEATRPC